MSLPKYEKYKAAPAEWISEVPSHWGVTRLRFLCKIVTGSRDTVNAIDGGSYPFFVRSQSIERIDTYALNCEAGTAGDGVGVGKVFHYYNGPFDFHQRVYAFTNFNGINGRFFFHYLKENFAKVALDGNAKSTVDSLRMPVIANFHICVPPLREQSAIVVFLDRETAKIDALVDEQKRLIELLKEKRQAVISHAVTKGLDPNAPIKDSGVEWLGQVPEHWGVTTIRRVAKSVQTGTTPSSEIASPEFHDGIPWYTPGDFQGTLRLSSSAKFVSKAIISRREARLFPCGSVLLVGIGATLGKVGYIKFASSANQQINCIVPTDDVDGYHLAYALSSLSECMKVLSNASTIGILNQEKTKDMSLVLPPLAEQVQITAHLDLRLREFDDLIEHAERAVELLQERRSALISAAITGKIDVRGIAAEIAEAAA